MAEIKIEKRKPIWPWIVLVLVIAVVIYYMTTPDADDRLEGGAVETDSSYLTPTDQIRAHQSYKVELT
ncbi:MAG TPA: hypothetical protein VF581_01410 [Flavobacterium sp.]|jgi:hypothetical protein